VSETIHESGSGFIGLDPNHATHCSSGSSGDALRQELFNG